MYNRTEIDKIAFLIADRKDMSTMIYAVIIEEDRTMVDVLVRYRLVTVLRLHHHNKHPTVHRIGTR